MKILSIFGTRPEAIKMAPLVKKIEKHPGLTSKVAVTAQHREMLDQVLDLFEIRADYDLDMMRHGQTLYDITSGALNGLQKVLAEEKPDLVLVHGDTTTTFAGALAAFYQQIPVGHVEAGLRTFNKFSPFPEEMNRRLTSSLADLHFAPTPTSKNNLLQEGVAAESIQVTGNTVIDALLETAAKPYVFADEILGKLDWQNKRILLLTCHRRENWGEPMAGIFKSVKRLAEDFADLEVVFPMHKNPLVRDLAREILGGAAKIHLIEPLDYQPFVQLMKKSTLVLTDSGGMQEEVPSLGKPVLVLRDTTERPEAVAAGTVKLSGTDPDQIYKDAATLLQDRKAYEKMALTQNPYGDGQASDKIIEILLNFVKKN